MKRKSKQPRALATNPGFPVFSVDNGSMHGLSVSGYALMAQYWLGRKQFSKSKNNQTKA